jgi:hypothetical protein
MKITSILVLWWCSVAARRASAQVDQQHLIASDTHYSAFNVRFDVRQEFTPTLNELDTVELFVGYPVFPASVSAAVAVREGGVDGPVLGMSTPRELPASFSGAVFFTFSERVKLTPGQLYAMQPLSMAGGPDWIVSVNSWNLAEPGYSGGKLFVEGRLVGGDVDLLFREGLDIPEPKANTLLTLAGLIAAAVNFCRALYGSVRIRVSGHAPKKLNHRVERNSRSAFRLGSCVETIGGYCGRVGSASPAVAHSNRYATA